jgi:hypothetical protein
MKNELYRRLAADGNKNAKHISDEYGAVPAAEMDEGGSESDAVEDLAAFAQKVGALKAKAAILAAAGDMKGAADTHMNRAREFDWRDQPGEAMRAYRDAATAYAKHAEEACAQLTPEQVKAWHAKGSE